MTAGIVRDALRQRAMDKKSAHLLYPRLPARARLLGKLIENIFEAITGRKPATVGY